MARVMRVRPALPGGGLLEILRAFVPWGIYRRFL